MYFADKEKTMKEKKKHKDMAEAIAGSTHEVVKDNTLCKGCKK